MKIAVSVLNNNLESKIDTRFGRAQYFVIYDTELKSTEIIENTAKFENSGAGSRVVKLLAENEVNIVLTGAIGPKALQALKSFDIEGYSGLSDQSVKEALSAFEKKLLQKE